MPGKHCAVTACKNNDRRTKAQEPKISYHRLPKEEKLQQKWIEACGGVYNPLTSYVCSVHFDEDDFEFDMQGTLLNYPRKRRLKPEAFPKNYLKEAASLVTGIKRKDSSQEQIQHQKMVKTTVETKTNLGNRLIISCSVNGCLNNSLCTGTSVRYHHFTKIPEISKKWVEASGWPPGHLNLQTARICSEHFSQDSFINTQKDLKHDAVPTECLPEVSNSYDDTLDHKNMSFAYTDIQQPETKEITVELDDPSHIDSILQQSLLSTNTLKEECDAKYQNIQTAQDLANLRAHNQMLRIKIDKLESSCNSLTNDLKELELVDKKISEEYMQLKWQCEGEKEMNNQKFPLELQKQLLTKVFSPSQLKILAGKKRIYWSKDDMALGYTLRHLSNQRCYEYLTENMKIPLPAISSLKRWTTSKKSGDRKNEGIVDESGNAEYFVEN